jgi:vesicle-associated membrane protein 7
LFTLQDYFSLDSNADKINQLRAGLSEVRDVVVDSLGIIALCIVAFCIVILSVNYSCSLSEKVLERGESIEHLLGRTENLQATSVNFKRKSEDLKNAMFWRNVKIYGAIAFVIIVCL